MAQVVQRNGLGKRSRLQRLQEAWREAVGREHAGQTRLASFRGGLLTVEVGSAALAHELGVYYKRELLARLRDRAGVPVEDLRCRVTGCSPSPEVPK